MSSAFHGSPPSYEVLTGLLDVMFVNYVMVSTVLKFLSFFNTSFVVYRPYSIQESQS